MREQPQQHVPAPGPVPPPGNLPAAAAAQPAQLTAKEKLGVNLKFKLFSYLQISSSGRLLSSFSGKFGGLPLAVLLCCSFLVSESFGCFLFPQWYFSCYAAEWLFCYYSSWSLQVNYALVFCPLFRPLFLTGCGYINYTLASVLRMHAWKCYDQLVKLFISFRHDMILSAGCSTDDRDSGMLWPVNMRLIVSYYITT